MTEVDNEKRILADTLGTVLTLIVEVFQPIGEIVDKIPEDLLEKNMTPKLYEKLEKQLDDL